MRRTVPVEVLHVPPPDLVPLSLDGAVLVGVGRAVVGQHVELLVVVGRGAGAAVLALSQGQDLKGKGFSLETSTVH